jgi:hypothetical protein
MSLENLEVMITQMFGSCSSNLQTLFGANSPRSSRYVCPNRNGNSSRSDSTITTEESSTNSKKNHHSNNKNNVRRTKSLDYRRRKKSRDTGIRRHRSMSKNHHASKSTSILPHRNIENTEIEVHHDDDVSAISAHTLDDMYDKEIRLQQIALAKANLKNLNRQPSAHSVPEPVSVPVPGPLPVSDGKENATTTAEEDSFLSEDTTEFESIWRTKSLKSPQDNSSNVDNYHSSAVKGSSKNNSKGNSHSHNHGNSNSDSIRRDSRISRSRKRELLKRSPFATIDENDSLYVDEQEI